MLDSLFILALGACADPTTQVPFTEGPTVAPAVDTGFPPGDVGVFQLDFGDGSRPARLTSAFFAEAAWALNPVTCALEPAVPCWVTFPSESEVPTELRVQDPPDFAGVSTVDQGDRIVLGGYSLDRVVDGGFVYYDRVLDGLPVPQAELTGQWTQDDLAVDRVLLDVMRGPLELTSPPPGSTVERPADGDLRLTWTPNVVGALTLTVQTPDDLTMLLLEDDGFFEVNLEALAGDADTVELTLTHWQTSVQRYRGHILDALATSEARITVTSPPP